MPAGHPPVRKAQGRRAAGQSRHARRHRLQVDVALSARNSCPTRASSRLPQALWYPILYGIVLNTRPKKSGDELRQDLEHRARRIAAAHLHARARPRSWRQRSRDLPDVVVDWGMRYGNPSTESAHREADRAGLRPHRDRSRSIRNISATTTATANDQLFRALMKMRGMPAIRTVPPYYDEPVYIDALARSIEQHLATLDFEPEVVLASYHGIPKAYFDKGDPYHCHCLKTTRLLRERLGWSDEEADHHLPVALRRAGMAAALHRQDGRASWPRKASSRSPSINPGLLGRLHRDAGGDRRRERPRSSTMPAARTSPHIPCLNDSAEGMARDRGAHRGAN